MLDTVELLGRCKDVAERERGARTDYAAAKMLGWAPQRFRSLMVGERPMTDAEVVQAARLAGVDPAVALASISAERAEVKGSEATPYWRALADTLERAKSAA